jgi:hypothetical protein
MTDSESLLQLGIAAAKEKNTEEARSLFRLLTREDPDNLQGWLWLAGVAENRDEKRTALENALRIDPENQTALQAIQKIDRQSGAGDTTPDQPTSAASGLQPGAATEAPASENDEAFAELDSLSDAFGQDPGAVRRETGPDAEPQPERTFDRSSESASATYARNDEETMSQSGSNNTLRILLGAALLLAILAVLMVVFNIPGRFFGGEVAEQEPTEQTEDAPDGQNGTTGTEPTDGTTPEGGAAPEDGTAQEGTGEQPPQEGTGEQPPQEGTGEQPPQEGTGEQPPQEGTGEQPPQEGTGEQPTQAPPPDVSNANPSVVPANTPLESNGWLYDFAQPEYANYFIGDFGQLQTDQGRIVIVLVRAVNRTGQAQPLPPDFFVLKDAQGRIYEPMPEASTAYINLFGRGPAGAADLSHEDQIPADGLTRSLPLIFDVAPDATDLVLFARSNPDQGWLVLQNVQ